MSKFLENDEYDPKNFVETEYGFALLSANVPHRRDVFWKQKSNGHIYTFDGDGWQRLHPPEIGGTPDGELNHG